MATGLTTINGMGILRSSDWCETSFANIWAALWGLVVTFMWGWSANWRKILPTGGRIWSGYSLLKQSCEEAFRSFAYPDCKFNRVRVSQCGSDRTCVANGTTLMEVMGQPR